MPMIDVTTPTGNSVGARIRRAIRSLASTTALPIRADGTSATWPEPTTRRAIAGAKNATNAPGRLMPSPARPSRPRQDQRQPAALDPHAESLRRIVAHLEHAN